jgi:basic membrane lipoprotein Med (substrate-binding protein (PBP1-ABC) superfamily)
MKAVKARVSVLFVVFALIASACAGAATPTQAPAPTQPPATQAPAATTAPTQAPAATTAATQAPGSTQAPAATQGSASQSGTFRIAAVFPSPVSDYAFSQSMYEALLKVQTDMGGKDKLDFAYSENLYNVPDAAAAIRDYASKGYNLVIAFGSQYGSSLQQIAPDFPNTSFAWATSTDTFTEDGINNVFALQANAEQGGYVQGVLGALMSKSGTLGIIGPVEAGDAKLYVDGFKEGALATKPNDTVNVTYTGSFSDVSLMSAAAETQVQNGADVLTGSSQSVVGAISVAKQNNAYWFGTQWDQTQLAPSVVVSSQEYDWTAPLKDMISNVQNGVLGGKSYTLTLANGGLVIQYNPAVTVPADAKAAADQAIKGIEDGSITVQP